MPAAKKRTELYVGMFILTGLVLLGGLVLQFAKFRERLGGQYMLTVVFDDASGLVKGSDVRMGGARIGEVASLPELNDAVRVEVELAIRKSIHIPTGSSFQINSATLLGDKLIVIVPPVNRSGNYIAAGSRLEGAGLTGLDAIQNNAEEVSKDVLRIIKEAEQTLVKVDAAVADIRRAGGQLREALDKVNGSMLSDTNLKRIDKTLENLESATGRWDAASGKVEPTLVDARAAIASVKQAAEGVEKTLHSANQSLSDLNPSLERIPKAVDQFTATTRKAGDALDRIKAGEGVLGTLASDNDVALDAKAFMRNLKEYGILFYKNPDTPADDRNAKKLPSIRSAPHKR